MGCGMYHVETWRVVGRIYLGPLGPLGPLGFKGTEVSRFLVRARGRAISPIDTHNGRGVQSGRARVEGGTEGQARQGRARGVRVCFGVCCYAACGGVQLKVQGGGEQVRSLFGSRRLHSLIFVSDEIRVGCAPLIRVGLL